MNKLLTIIGISLLPFTGFAELKGKGHIYLEGIEHSKTPFWLEQLGNDYYLVIPITKGTERLCQAIQSSVDKKRMNPVVFKVDFDGNGKKFETVVAPTEAIIEKENVEERKRLALIVKIKPTFGWGNQNLDTIMLEIPRR